HPRVLLSNANDDNQDTAEQWRGGVGRGRRPFLERGARSAMSSLVAYRGFAASANARGLVRFPCKEPLLNTYHFLRAGASLLEVEDVWSTNPLFLTNREAALSELGEEQVREACRYLRAAGPDTVPTVVRYSLAAASVDSANIVGEELRIGRDRLVPEFNYMDPRAIGAWDYASLNATEGAVWALDADEAGPSGRGGRPPPNEDGTPAETLADQVVRLTNLMSVLETLYSGDTVLLVFPDGTGPALLSCLIGGIPLNRVHELQFLPGEIRCNVDYGSINTLASREPPLAYLDTLEQGRSELRQLRETPDTLRNIKDLKYDEDFERERVEQEKKRMEENKEAELKAQRRKEERLQLKSRVARVPRNKTSSTSQNETSMSTPDSGKLGIAATALGAAAISFLGTGSDGDDNAVITHENATLSDVDHQPVHDSSTGASSLNDTIVVEQDQPKDEPSLHGVGNDQNVLAETSHTIADVQNISTDEPTNTTLLDDTSEGNYEAFSSDGLDELPSREATLSSDIMGEEQDSDMDYDDGWLGAIADIMNEDDENDTQVMSD
ncbi:hypothetical protein ACHAWF_011723, partial [Thalassiosira exigua]